MQIYSMQTSPYGMQASILSADPRNRRAAARRSLLSSLLLFHAGQAAIKLPSAEASKRAQCTSPGQYAPYIKGIMKTP